MSSFRFPCVFRFVCRSRRRRLQTLLPVIDHVIFTRSFVRPVNQGRDFWLQAIYHNVSLYIVTYFIKIPLQLFIIAALYEIDSGYH